MTYHLAATLVQLRSEVNALWPSRDRASDGWIGDTSHSARKSDHNPDYASGGVVRALDVDRDGIDADALLVCAITDWRVAYVIFEGLIYVRDEGFRPRRYTGTNSHHHHLHISIRHGAIYERSTASWELAKRAGHPGGAQPTPAAPAAPTPTPTPSAPPTPEEITDMNPFMLIAPDTTQYLVTPQAGRPRATKIAGGEVNDTLRALPRIQPGKTTWTRLSGAFEFVG